MPWRTSNEEQQRRKFCEAALSQKGSFEQLCKIMGSDALPKAIRCDNGGPFGSRGALGLSKITAWTTKIGIIVDFIDPGKPQQNGTGVLPGLKVMIDRATRWKFA